MKQIKIILTFLIIISSHAYSQVFISACSNSPKLNIHVTKSIQFLKTQGDKFKKSTYCIEIITTNKREELYTKYIKRKNPNAQLTRSTEYLTQAQCRLELIKKTVFNNSSESIENKKKHVFFKTTNNNENKVQRVQIVVMDKKSVTIKINDEELFLNCVIKRSGYQIKLTTSSANFLISNSFNLSRNETKTFGSFSEKSHNQKQNVQIIKNSLKLNERKRVIHLSLKAL